MPLTSKVVPKDKVKDWLFRQVHSKNLVYNTCWEDPRCDRELMQIDSDSNIVMITSAGCNALDYLLDAPASINCIDMNPRQNSLMELKKAMFDVGDFDALFQFFGKGICRHAKSFYRTKLREALPDFAAEYWDKNIRYFDGKGVRRTFYHYGTAGTFAWFASRYFQFHKLKYVLQDLLDAKSLEDQAEIYQHIEEKVLGGLMEWIINRHFTMVLLGVPRSQQKLFMTKYPDGAMGFVRSCLRHVFTALPISDNYFWRLYINGEYTMSCSPEYLKPENFDLLKSDHHRIHTHTTTLSQFLIQHPGEYSHYVLLDHQDWLASNDVEALETEWRLILENSKPGTRVLLRSASHQIDFFPEFVNERVTFERELTTQQHPLDRVGTYGSVYMAIVN